MDVDGGRGGGELAGGGQGTALKCNTTISSSCREAYTFSPRPAFCHLAWMRNRWPAWQAAAAHACAAVGLRLASWRSVKASQQWPNHHSHDTDANHPQGRAPITP